MIILGGKDKKKKVGFKEELEDYETHDEKKNKSKISNLLHSYLH